MTQKVLAENGLPGDDSGAGWERLVSRTITSRTNPVVKRMRALSDRKERDRRRVFMVEGILPVWRAVDANVPLDTLVIAPDLLTSEGARDMVVRQAVRGARVIAVAGAVFEQIAERDHPSGLAAIVPELDLDLAHLPGSSTAMFAVLHSPSNPGNLGTSMRTIDATGGGGAIIIGGTDVYSPACVKASMGTIFSVPFSRVDTWASVRTWCRAHQLVTVATSSRAERDLWSTQLPERSVLLFGNEGEGLPRDVVEDCDLCLKIPMAHGGSLNLAVAVAVVLFEYRRQHRPR